LSGGGADEVFAGYPKYRFASFPSIARAGLRLFTLENAVSASSFFGIDAGRMRVAFHALTQSRELDRVVKWFSQIDRQVLRAILPGLDWTDATWSDTMAVQEAALSRSFPGGSLFRMQAVDCLTWLPSNILESDDRMSMAEGIEMRAPFLDKRLVSFALALPDRLKIRDFAGKWILRSWGNNLLPPEILRRKKWGFKAPLAEWFRGPLGTMASDYLMSKGGFCDTYGDRLAISRLFDSHRLGKIDWSATLWMLFSTEVWYQDVFRASGRNYIAP